MARAVDWFVKHLVTHWENRSQWNAWRMILLSLTLGLLIEALTAIMRFGFGLEAASPSDLVQACTLGLRVHHCYTGLVCLLLAAVLPRRPELRNVLVVVGASLVLSDLVHHFFVLWPITGHHEFYFVYPHLD